MDHVGYGIITRYFIYPPRMLPNEDLSSYSDGLQDVILEKLQLIVTRQDELVEEKNLKLKAIENVRQKDGMTKEDLYFWHLWVEIEFEEYFILQRWIRYWLRIKEKVDPIWKAKYIQVNNEKIQDWQIEQALESPLEDQFSGILRPTGNRLFGFCPFHEEKTPSFCVYKEQNTFHCFGCGAHGDVIKFVMRRDKIKFPDAVRKLL